MNVIFQRGIDMTALTLGQMREFVITLFHVLKSSLENPNYSNIVLLDYFSCLCCVGSWLLFWILRLLFCMPGVFCFPKTQFPPPPHPRKTFLFSGWSSPCVSVLVLFLLFLSCLSCFFFSCFVLFQFLFLLVLPPVGISVLVSCGEQEGKRFLWLMICLMFWAYILLLVCLLLLLFSIDWYHTFVVLLLLVIFTLFLWCSFLERETRRRVQIR